MLNIKALKELNGDCITISYGAKQKYNILIDGGQGRVCFRQLCAYVDNIKNAENKINLLILTHIDSDHIDGILRLLSQKTFDFSIIEEMWFDFGKGLHELEGINGENHQVSLYADTTEISWKQGVDLEKKIQEAGIKRRIVTKLERFSVGDAIITILSPSREVLKKFSEQDKNKEKKTRQIVISTHNEQFYKLLKVKMDERYYPSKFIELTSTGKVKV